MKIIHLFNNFCPQKKCGADPVSAGLFAGGSLLGNVLDVTVGYDQQKDMARYNLDRQAQENQLNRDWQTTEAEKARQFISSQVLQQNAFQKVLQQQQHLNNLDAMQRQAWYNSPAYQKSELTRAGINPQVYFGQQSSFSGSSAQSGGAPSAPSPGSSPTVGSAPGLSPIGFQPTKLAIGSLLKEIAEASGTFGENERAWQKLGAEIRNLTVDSDLKDLMRVGQAIMNSENYLSLPYRVKMAAKNLEKVVSEIELNDENKITLESVRKVNEAVARFNDVKSSLTNKEIEKMGLEMPYYVSILKAQINKMGAEASEARAVARNQISQAELNDLERTIKKNAQGDIEDEFFYRVDNMKKEGKILDWQADAAESAAEQARVAADHAEELFWKDFVLDIFQHGVDAFTSVRNSGSWSRMSNASQRRVDAKLKEIEQHYGDKVEITNGPKGTTRTRTYRRGYQKYGNTKD